LHAGWRKITAVPNDATVPTKLTAEIVRAATASGTPLAKYVAQYAQPGFPMWDEVAAGVLVDPSLVKLAGELAMDIDLSNGPNYGGTLSWPKGKGPDLGEPDVTVALAVDVPRLERLFIDLIGSKLPAGK